MTKREDALEYHRPGRPGQIARPDQTRSQISGISGLAYSPESLGPALKSRTIRRCYLYTSKGNLDRRRDQRNSRFRPLEISARWWKAVMEGKGNLFKSFADLDVFDLEVGSEDPQDVIRFCQLLEPTVWRHQSRRHSLAGLFLIERRWQTMKIPVFHDDQHGTAIISGAALLNALEVVKRKIEDVKVVFSGRVRRDLDQRNPTCASRDREKHFDVRQEGVI